MQQMVGPLSQGLLEIGPVQRLDIRVLMREPDLGPGVHLPELAPPLGRMLLAAVDRLPAAAGTAAGTGHDLHEIVVRRALLDRVHQLPGARQPADHRHPHVPRAGDVEHGLLPGLVAPDGLERVGVRVFPRHHVIRAAQRRVHHAARCAEDHRRAGARPQRAVELRLFQVGRDDAVAPEQAAHLPGRQHHVHVRIAAGVPHGGQFALRLLRGAGHDGRHEDLVGIEAHLLGKVALRHRAEHLLGRLRRRQMVRITGILGLEEPDPGGTAGGEHGPAVLPPMGEAVDELTALFHDGQVGGEVGVEDIVEADALQRRHHAAGRRLLGGHVEDLRPGRPHRRGHLDDSRHLGIGQRPEDLRGVVPDRQRPGGAVGDALAAEDAVRVLQIAVVAHVHRGPGAGARHVPDVHALDLVADLDAAHTLDALAGLPDDGDAQIHLLPRALDLIGLIVDVQVMGQALELAVPAADADGAVGIVLGEDEPQVRLPGRPDPGGVRPDDHAL